VPKSARHLKVNNMKKNLYSIFIALFLFQPALIFAGSSKLAAKEFASIEIKNEPASSFTFGQKIQIGIVAVNAKGKEYKTPGFLSPGLLKTVEWSAFTISVEGGVFENGNVWINKNLEGIKNHQVKISASTVKNPDVKHELIIKLDYKGTTIANVAGTTGENGKQGAQGAKGPNAVTSSDNASHGGTGGQGQQGGDGGDGQNVEVYIKLKFDDVLQKEMLYVKVNSNTTGEEQMFITDPDGGKLIVNANGGDGGNGGEGGKGGQGGDDVYKKWSGNGGTGGPGGQGGDGGNGGSLLIYIDPSTDKINTEMNFTNEGGLAGRGGAPGDGGFKGYHNNATGGQKGTAGTAGHAGRKGPEVKIIKQAVDF
jgi:hypothetical protein